MPSPLQNVRQTSGRISDPALHSNLQQPNPLLVVISGPSGVGKDAVVKRMQERAFPFSFVVTATSRPPREGEKHGLDYFFISKQDFEDLLARGEFIEHALVYGQHYGVPKDQIRRALASRQDAVMRVDVQGAATVRHLLPDAVLIFLLAESEEELLNRLRTRKTESAENLQRRIDMLHEELRRVPEFDYVVINRTGQLDHSVDQIAAIIQAEKCRTRQRVIQL